MWNIPYLHQEYTTKTPFDFIFTYERKISLKNISLNDLRIIQLAFVLASQTLINYSLKLPILSCLHVCISLFFARKYESGAKQIKSA